MKTGTLKQRMQTLVTTTLTVLAASGSLGLAEAEDTQPASPAQTQSNAMSVQSALEAMKGMGGYYRKTAEGDVLLFPLGQGDSWQRNHPATGGMQGMSGMEGMEAMGGVSGYFHVQPSGQTTFYPYPGVPVGMSGMSGRPAGH
ncbi:MAG: hypothetical protein KFB96_05440 [Thiocapsa sp.]|uniref:hypothetical protein n=1 Tax=Thiocapsa sp. TaxID=2024551 RepID=UPI001BCF1933|nr:hypothetical protein [Thiocapsa sp.]QVL49925.1 MAG: hypothetical protein KFB96_05440 [Thiocapsa sp.]